MWAESRNDKSKQPKRVSSRGHSGGTGRTAQVSVLSVTLTATCPQANYRISLVSSEEWGNQGLTHRITLGIK